ATAPDLEAEPRALLAGRSLLIVDTQPRTRTWLAELAALWGMDVRATGRGEDALLLMQEAATRRRPFDLVVVDSAIGDEQASWLAGYGVAGRGGAQPSRFVLLAAAGLRGDAGRAQAAGFDAYLPHGTRPELIRTCLQRLLGARSAGLLTLH